MGIDRHHGALLPRVSDRRAAPDTDRVLEEELRSADLAVKCAHESSLCQSKCSGQREGLTDFWYYNSAMSTETSMVEFLASVKMTPFTGGTSP
jgi:hypothetical protein